MANVLLTSENYIKKATNIDDNVQAGYLGVALREAQEIDLQSIIGKALLEKLKRLVDDNSIERLENKEYKTLLDNYIQPYLSYATITKLIMIAAIKISNIGVNQVADENINNLTLDETFRLQEYYQGKVDYYCKRLQEYIVKNAVSFPELNGNSCNEIQANLYSSASCGLFLGGARGKKSRKSGLHTYGGSGSGSGGGMTPEEVQSLIDAALEMYTKTDNFATINEELITAGGDFDLPTKEYVSEKGAELKAEIESEIPSLEGYATEDYVNSALTEYTKTADFATINGSGITEGGNIVIEGGGKKFCVLNDMTTAERAELYDAIIGLTREEILEKYDLRYRIGTDPGGYIEYIALDQIRIYSNVIYFRGQAYMMNGSNRGGFEYLFVGNLQPKGAFTGSYDKYAITLCIDVNTNSAITYNDTIYQGYFSRIIEGNCPVSLNFAGKFTTMGRLSSESGTTYVYAEFMMDGIPYEAKWKLQKNETPIYWRTKQNGAIVNSIEEITNPYEGLHVFVRAKYKTYFATSITPYLPEGEEQGEGYAGHFVWVHADGGEEQIDDLYFTKYGTLEFHWGWINDGEWHKRFYGDGQHNFLYKITDGAFIFLDTHDDESGYVKYVREEQATGSFSLLVQETLKIDEAKDYTYFEELGWYQHGFAMKDEGATYREIYSMLLSNPQAILDRGLYIERIGELWKVISIAPLDEGANVRLMVMRKDDNLQYRAYRFNGDDGGLVYDSSDCILTGYENKYVFEAEKGSASKDGYYYTYKPEEGFEEHYAGGRWLVGDLNGFRLWIEILKDSGSSGGDRLKIMITNENQECVAEWDNYEWENEWDWQEYGKEHRFYLKVGFIGNPYTPDFRTILCSVPLEVEEGTELEAAISEGYVTFNDNGFTHFDTIPSTLLNNDGRQVIQYTKDDIQLFAKEDIAKNGIKIGNTTLSEAQLQALLALLG